MGAGLSDVVPRVAGLLDLILNIVALLLWFNWRAGGIKTAPPGVVSLAGTLQRTEVAEPQRWFSFGCLAALLFIRPLLALLPDWVEGELDGAPRFDRDHAAVSKRFAEPDVFVFDAGFRGGVGNCLWIVAIAFGGE
jgi:hypothetical protein